MTRLLLLSLCLLVLAPLPAAARITGQPDNWHREQPETRDLASIRRAGVLKVLVNQSRNSSGEVKGEPIGVEYRRLRAFEQYLNSRSPSARNLTLKLIPKPKDQLLAALQRGEGDLVAPANCCRRTTACRSARARRCAPMCRWCWWRARATGATRLEQLSGRTIPLPAGSAAERHRTGQPAPGATPHGTDPDRKAGRFPGRRGCDGNGPGRHPRLHRGRAAHRRTLGQGAAEAARRPPPGAGQSRRHGLVRAPRCQHPARDHRPLPRRLPRAGRPGRGFPARLPARLQGPQPSARRTASAWKRSVHCCSATRGRAAWTGWRWRRWPTRSRT